MKILQVINALTTGGAEKVVLDLASGLHARGHEVTVLTLVGDPKAYFAERLRSQGIPVVALCDRGSVYSPLVIPRLASMMSGFDVVHVHLFPAQYWAAMAARLSRAPRMITTEHSTNNRRRGSRLWRAVDRAVYRRYDAVVPCSADAAVAFADAFPGMPITMIPNGVDLTAIDAAEPARLDVAPDVRLIGMVARLADPKRQDVLIRTLTLLPDRYHIALAGAGANEDSLRSLARALGVDSRCHFLGVRSDVPSLLKTCWANCLLSNYEGLSISSVECLASGRPFIASDVPGLRDVVSGYGLLTPNDPEAVASAILSLDNPAYYAAVADACSARSRNYDLANTLDAYLELYNH